jgi:hypothetical protein
MTRQPHLDVCWTREDDSLEEKVYKFEVLDAGRRRILSHPIPQL